MNIPITRSFLVCLALCLVPCDTALLHAAPAKSPDDVFKESGVSRTGSYLVVPEETELLTATRALRTANAKQVSDAHSRQALQVTVDKAIADWRAAIAERDKAFAEMKANPRDHDRLGGIYNVALGKAGQQFSHARALYAKLKAFDDARSTYINLTVQAMDNAVAAKSRYRELAGDAALKNALAAVNKNSAQPIKLGPSAAFAPAIDFVLTCRGEMMWDLIPVQMDGTVPEVDVEFNGAVTQTMIWDSGASFVCLNSKTAAALHLHPSDQDETVASTLADGAKVYAKLMVLKSVRVGGVTVENVECLIAPDDRSPNLLGATFQNRCVCKLEVPKRQLLLTRIEPPGPGYKPTTRPSLDIDPVREKPAASVASAAIAAVPTRAKVPVTNRPPKVILEEKQLFQKGFLLLVNEEPEIHTLTVALREAGAKSYSESQTRREITASINRAIARRSEIDGKFRRLNEAYTSAVGAAKNQYVNPINSLIAEDKKLRAEIVAQYQRGQKLTDTEPQFLTLSLEAVEKAEKAAVRYADLAEDDDLKSAIARLNEASASHVTLGPSTLFQEDLHYIRGCKVDTNSGVVPISANGNIAHVDVMINETLRVPMIWDSGASDVLLSADMADKLGLHPTDADPSIQSQVADGRIVMMKQMILKTVRVGALTAYNVPCSIMPPGVKVDEGLLGIAFQKNFKCQLDLKANQLHLTRIQTPEK